MKPLLPSMLLVIVWSLVPCSCSKLVDAPSSGNEMTAASVFASDAGAEAAMIGVYTSMMDNTRGLMNGSISIDAGLSSDELDCTRPFPQEDSFRMNNLSSGNILSNGLFSTAYNLIYALNSILAGIQGSSGMSAPVKSELEGEARCNRALLYFYLVNLYGGVPLVLTTNSGVASASPRVGADSVYRQIIADLQAAAQLLPADYLTAPGYLGDRTRPNSAAATALLARVWLYLGQWASAEQAATTVIDDPRYQLEPNLDSVFLSVSQEAIWQLQPLHGTMESADGFAYLVQLPPGRPTFVVTPQLLGSMENGDLRRTHWIDSSVFLRQTYHYPYKYKLAFTSTIGAKTMEYEMVLRLAEQYLIRAEARAQQGNLGGAIADLNLIRARAGLPGTIATDQADLLAAILHERRIELMTEWGHRWLDLKRLDQANGTLAGEKSWWQARDTLYPIPATELLINPGMPQNPGYQ